MLTLHTTGDSLRSPWPPLHAYLSGFGNEFASEALAGALPREQNTPRSRRWAYASRLNGTAFTAPRGVSRSTWTYRIRPSAMHKPFKTRDARLIRSGPFNEVPPTPNQLRWRAMPIPAEPTDFIDGIVTIGGNGDPASQSGAAIHMCAANISMRDRFFYNADGELLIVPQAGPASSCTLNSVFSMRPQSSFSSPRGIKFRVELVNGSARVHLRELRSAFAASRSRTDRNVWFGERARFRNASGNVRDREGDFRLVAKTVEDSGKPRSITLRSTSSPGAATICRSGTTSTFQCINTVTFDHPIRRSTVSLIADVHLVRQTWSSVLSATMDRCRAHVPSTTVPSKCRE